MLIYFKLIGGYRQVQGPMNLQQLLNADVRSIGRWLRLGWADVCLAGACNLDVTPMSLACFGNLGALSRRNAAPAAAS